MRPLLHRLRRDRRGATIVEFAIIAPVMALTVLGLCDVMYQAYAQSLLDGAIQKAARDSAIQGGADQTATLDARVQAVVRQIAPSATFVSSRKTYSSFAAMVPEPFTDNNNDGIRETGECYSDINGNGQWDADPSRSGQGGASDATLYSVTVTYPHLFPVKGLLGWSGTQSIAAHTLIMNQPYTQQIISTPQQLCN